MGILKDSKRTPQGIKAPIPVPGSWATRVANSNDYVPSTTSDEVEPMLKLQAHIRALATDLETTWLEQEAHLKAAEIILNGFIKHKLQLSQQALDYLRLVAAPIFVECYFLPSNIVIRRRTLLPIQLLTTVVDSSECVVPLLQANFLAFIGAPTKGSEAVDGPTRAVYAAQTGGQRAQAIEMLASTSQGGLVVGQFIGDILSFAANELEPALLRLTGPPQGMGSAELVLVRDGCTQAVRLVFLCLSKFASSTDTAKDAATLPRIYELCWNLIGCDNAALNSRQVAAMVLVQLIECSGQPPAERAAMLALHLLDLQTTTPALVAYLPSADSLESRQRSMDDAVAMVCVARAIISVAPNETALSELDLVASSRSPGGCNTVHEAVFTHIASICGRSQLAPAVKVLVFEAMATWLEQTALMLQRILVSDEIDRAVVIELGKRVLLLQRERIMGYLLSYWDDPLDAVQAKVRAIFEAFLDIGSAMAQAVGRDSVDPQEDEVDIDPFLDNVLDLVLTMDWTRKVKYSLLATLCTRISLVTLFQRQPDILDSCFETLAQVTMAPRASTLLTALLERSAKDIANEAGGDLEDQYMALWAPPVVAALCKDDESSRRMLAQHVLPALVGLLPGIASVILRSLTTYQLLEPSQQQQTLKANRQQQTLDANRQHALIIVLKAARSKDLITMDELVNMDVEQANGNSLVDMLHRAVYHPDWSVRADMLGLLCEARKLALPLHELEYNLLFKLLRASANAPSADFRQQQYGALTILATRLATIATHAERIVSTGRPPVPSQKVRHREKARREAAVAKALAEGRTEDQALRELGILPADEMIALASATLAGVQRAVDQWLDLTVRGCLYPGAGFAKVAMGLRWLDILSTHFGSSCAQPLRVAGLGSPDFAKLSDNGRSLAVAAEEVVSVLTQVLIDDPFDVNRAGAFTLLTAWPLSSEGADATQQWANSLLQRALFLVSSTRAGESESGALIIRWVFRKFVVLQNMRLDIVDSLSSDLPCDLAFVGGLLELIRRGQVAAERNLLDAAQRHPLHGLLTAAQYVAEEVDFASADVQQHVAQWQQWLEDLAEAAMGVCNVVLSVLTSASPEGNIPASFREMEDKIDAIIQSARANTEDIAEPVTDDLDDDDDELLVSGDVELDGPVGPRQQVILSYCWRAIKEVSGLLAVIATRPMGSDHTTVSIGSLLRTLLTSIRHRGAFSAVHPAFTSVCGQMMRSSNPALNGAVSNWLDQCLDTATICQVSVTRRSAGWPLCLLSILTCDKLATQALLPRAVDRLFTLASDLQIKTDSQATTEGTTDLPQVHAINMLRVLLDDHTLAADIVPYIEHAYVLSLTGLRSSRWAIRNVCGLLYAALTRRVFGNNKSRDDSKYDGITGRELFTRFPGLHPFLTNQLEDAVDQMADAESLMAENHSEHGDPLNTVLRSGAQFIHPALYPCLILLSRLQPSPLDSTSSPSPSSSSLTEPADSTGVVAQSPHSESATSAVAPPMNLEEEPLTRVNERNSTVHVTSASTMLSMYSFTELVEMCVDSPVFKTREMAARAFAPLVPSDRATGVVVSLLKGLRDAGNCLTANSSHGTLCQIHELLRVHFSTLSTSVAMRRAFIGHVFPALTALWPLLIHSPTRDHGDSKSDEDNAIEVSDIVRHRYLLIVNEYVARGELWTLTQQQQPADQEFVKSAQLALSRFRISVLYGSLHPLFANRRILRHLGNSQTPGAFGTVLELTRLFLACVDDRTMAVMQTDGSVQLRIDSDDSDDIGNQVQYNPWPVLSSLLANNEFYEAKLAVLEWMSEHAENENMEIFSRVGVTNVLTILIAGIETTTGDPLVRAASTRLLALLCTKLEISPAVFPVDDLLAFWDRISAQLGARFCPISVALALTLLQSTLIHMLYTQSCNDGAHSRLRAWANHLYEWADPERATPYRQAVSRSLVTYSAIKRFHETTTNMAVVDPASEEILRLCYWRILQDDDEEIRDYVAQSISRRLGRQLGCDQACERLIADFEPSGTLFPHTYVSNRLAYLLVLPSLEFSLDAAKREARQAVDMAINPSRVLFDHEPPNIYIDQSRNMQLAYYSLITIASSSFVSESTAEVFIKGAMCCVEALDAALLALRGSDNTTMLGGATSLSLLYSLIQSWILGARLAVFTAARLGNNHVAVITRVKAVVGAWLTPQDNTLLGPVHPWIIRALCSLDDLCSSAESETGAIQPISKDRAVSDLFLLTYV
ncbi:hypothetical protein GGH94_005166 [Coemansia aciculifera]|uniref:DUF2428 domain-containing protein n=1 Tax=Coemansia aciculifera TaxID=417176 RepID=A0A9W8M2X0_9FUNG|nr:hypothetical protein GGH94_005166 [Coemansia aciculifera]